MRIKNLKLKRKVRQLMSTNNKNDIDETNTANEINNMAQIDEADQTNKATETDAEFAEKSAEKALAKQAFKAELKELAVQGLWKNNPGIVQLLGLCPLLAVTATITNALGLGLATLLVLIASNTTVSAIRHWVPKEIRIPIFVLIIASFVTCVQLLMNAYTYSVYQSLRHIPTVNRN